MLACIGKTSSQDFKMQQQGELAKKILNRQSADMKSQTLQIPRKGKKVERKDTLECAFLDDRAITGKGVECRKLSSPYLDEITVPSLALNGRLSAITEESRELCSGESDGQVKDRSKYKTCTVTVLRLQNASSRNASQDLVDKNRLQIP